MRKIALFVFLFIGIILVTSNVKASVFDVTPKQLSASVSQLLNFTVNDTESENITEVNVTIPPGFTDTVNYGTTASNVNPPTGGNPVVWSNKTVEGFVSNGTTEYFWFNITTPSVSFKEYNFTLTVAYTNGTTESSNLTVQVNDTTAPTFSDVGTSKPNETIYSPGANYGFQITFKDNVNVSKIIFSSNFNSSTNITVTLYSGSQSNGVYVINFTDLPAGTYWYMWYANDTSDNWVKTDNYTYVIQKAPNLIDVYINGQKNKDVTVENGTIVNVTGTGENILFLYKNETYYVNNTEKVEYDFKDQDLLSVGTYLIKINATGNTNYTTNSTGASYIVKMIYHRPRYTGIIVPSSHIYSSGASYTFKTTFYSLDAPTDNITNVSFTWQSSTYYLSITNNSYATYSYTVKDLAAGSYSWKWCAKDTQGEENCTSGTFTVNKVTPSLTIYGTGSYEAPINITVIGLGCPTSGASDVVCKLYKNDTLVSGNEYQLSTNKVGYWVFVFNTSGGANYTSASASGVVNVFAVKNVTNVTQTVNKTTTTQPVTNVSQPKPKSKPKPTIILNETKFFSKVTPQTPAVYKVKQPGIFKVEEIEIKVKKASSNVKIIVAPALKVKVSSPIQANKGLVFTYFQINSSLSETNIEESMIKFQVTKQWIKTNKINPNSVALYRWSGSWQKLETKKISEDENYIHYQAVSPGLSLYAVAGEKAGGISWNWIWIAIVIVIAVVLAYLLWPTETGKQYEYLKRKWTKPFHLKFSL